MTARACACAFVLVALAAAAVCAAAEGDPVPLVENTNYYATLPAGALAQQHYAFVAAAAAVYNVRITRHAPFADPASTQRLCVHANTSALPTCIPLSDAADAPADGTDGADRYSVTVTAPAPGTAFVATVASAGEGYSYTVRYCRGRCAAQCDADCSGHGGCPVPGLWCACDAGRRGSRCASTRGSDSSDDDSSDPFGALVARLLAALVYGLLALAGTALLGGGVAALLVCCGAVAGVSLCAGACCCACACCAGSAAARPTRGAVHAVAAERQPLVVSVVPAAVAVAVPPPPYPAYPAYPDVSASAVVPPAV